MKYILPLVTGLVAGMQAVGQVNLPQDRPKLACGPMLGYAEMREASIWIQSSVPGKCHLRYWPKDMENEVMTNYGTTTEASGNTAEFVLTNLEPGTTYEYELNVGGYLAFEGYKEFSTQPLWQYRTEPPDFKLAFGSCTFINEPKYDRPGEGYGGDYHIFESIARANPDLMLWGGDNIYLREVDNTRSGMIYRYSHTRAIPEMQELLSMCPHYATWDDHDYGPNNANGSHALKKEAREVFDLFWANPVTGADGEQDISSQFTWGDIDFFLLDNRTHRIEWNISGQTPTVLGQEQIDWLISALSYSQAPFKMVVMGGQFLNPVARYENYANWGAERQKILDLIEQNKITGVIFLTGDRHCTELSKLTQPGGNVVYDLTVSPLTSGAYDNTKEANTLRVDGTLVPERNFATLSFTGKRKERVLKIEVFDCNGKLKWTKEITQPGFTKP